MPGNPQHGKAGHHSKKSKAKQRAVTMPVQQQAVARPHGPVAADNIPAPVEKVRHTEKVRAAAASGTIRHPYVIAELKRSGILAGMILVILVVLTIVLS